MSGPYNTATGLGSKGRVTSTLAAEKAAHRAAALRTIVLDRIVEAGPAGLTPEECAALLGEDILSIRPRFSELSVNGLIAAQRVSGDLRRKERRRSRLGALSTVMVAAKFERRGPSKSPARSGESR